MAWKELEQGLDTLLAKEQEQEIESGMHKSERGLERIVDDADLDYIQDIVAGTELPREIWPANPSLSLPDSEYGLCRQYFNHTEYRAGRKYQEVLIHEVVIEQFDRLSVEQILGQASLLRTPTQLTAMVSVAEAATVTLNKPYRQLLWILMKLIERRLDHNDAYYYDTQWVARLSLIARREKASSFEGLWRELRSLHKSLVKAKYRQTRFKILAAQKGEVHWDHPKEKEMEKDVVDLLSVLLGAPPPNSEDATELHTYMDALWSSTEKMPFSTLWEQELADDAKLGAYAVDEFLNPRKIDQARKESIGSDNYALSGFFMGSEDAANPETSSNPIEDTGSEKASTIGEITELSEDAGSEKIAGSKNIASLEAALTIYHERIIKEFKTLLRKTFALCGLAHESIELDWKPRLSSTLLSILEDVLTKLMLKVAEFNSVRPHVHQSSYTDIPMRYKYTLNSVSVYERNSRWYFLTEVDAPELEAVRTLSKWLASQLGLPTTPAPWPFPRPISLYEENCFAKDSLSRAQSTSVRCCWRNKLLSGNVFQMPSNGVGVQAVTTQSHEQGSLPIQNASDYLMLTAAALWALFDNAFKRSPNCQCTFQTIGGDYLQCRKKERNWFIWHTFSTDPKCGGTDCTHNVAISLSSNERGTRLYTNSPCILGWPAMGRTSADSPLWDILGVSANMKRKGLTEYPMTGFQIGAQLTVPGGVGPQLGGVVTFAKREYEVSNSTTSSCRLATEMAACATVLLYDERRDIYLTIDGADVIEVCCLQFLRDVGYDTDFLPTFEGLTAVQRLQTWCSSNFVLLHGTHLPGDVIIREASAKVWRLIEASRNLPKEKLLHWLFEDVLRGKTSLAVKVPKSSDCSWHQLASTFPPLILVVGQINDSLLTLSKVCFRREESKSETRKIQHFSEFFRSGCSLGGIVSSQALMQRWMRQCESFLQLRLLSTRDTIYYGDKQLDNALVHKLITRKEGEATKDCYRFGYCGCVSVQGQTCLHYLQ